MLKRSLDPLSGVLDKASFSLWELSIDTCVLQVDINSDILNDSVRSGKVVPGVLSHPPMFHTPSPTKSWLFWKGTRWSLAPRGGRVNSSRGCAAARNRRQGRSFARSSSRTAAPTTNQRPTDHTTLSSGLPCWQEHICLRYTFVLAAQVHLPLVVR